MIRDPIGTYDFGFPEQVGDRGVQPSKACGRWKRPQRCFFGYAVVSCLRWYRTQTKDEIEPPCSRKAIRHVARNYVFTSRTSSFPEAATGTHLLSPD